MNDSTYHFIAVLIRLIIWGGWKKSARLEGAENLQGDGPAIFIGNHAESLGPIGCVSMLPLRLYPWIRPEMLNLRTNRDYMRANFIEKELHLKPPLSSLAAQALSRVVVPLLNGIGSIPAFQQNHLMEIGDTVEQSMTHLRQGHYLLVFPEVPEWESDPKTGIRRFSYSVLWLAELYGRETGKPLPFYPVCIHPTHQIRLGQAVLLGEQEVASQAQKRMWIGLLERSIQEMYLEIEKKNH